MYNDNVDTYDIPDELKKDLEKDPGNETLRNQLDQKEARLNYISKENAVGKSLMQNKDFAENYLKLGAQYQLLKLNDSAIIFYEKLARESPEWYSTVCKAKL